MSENPLLEKAKEHMKEAEYQMKQMTGAHPELSIAHSQMAQASCAIAFAERNT